MRVSCFVCSFPAWSPSEYRTTLCSKREALLKLPRHQSLRDQPQPCNSEAQSPWLRVKGSFTKHILLSWFPSSLVMSWQESKHQETRCQKGFLNSCIPNLCWITRMHAISILQGRKASFGHAVLPALDPPVSCPQDGVGEMYPRQFPLCVSTRIPNPWVLSGWQYCKIAGDTLRECGSCTVLSSRVWARL